MISSDEGTNFYRFERIVDDINDVEVGSVQDLFKEAQKAWGHVADLESDVFAHLLDNKKLKEELTQAKAQLAQALIEQSDIIDVPGEHDSLEEFIENLEFTYPMVRLNQVIVSTLLTLSRAYARAGYPEGESINDFFGWLEDFSKDLPDILSAKLNFPRPRG